MPDIADIASEREQLETALAIATARRAPPATPQPMGYCHNCDEPIDGAAFCDVDCRDDWQARQRPAR
jgi:hypothetical protein